jgi:hypothetical protein
MAEQTGIVSEGASRSRWYHPPARILARNRISALKRAADSGQQTDPADKSRLTARRMLDHADHVLDQRGRLSIILRRSDVEALSSVDDAELELVRGGHGSDRMAVLSAVLHRTRTELPHDDVARLGLERFISLSEPADQTPAAAVTAALAAANQHRRRAVGRMKALTSSVLVVAALGALFAIGLAVLGLIRPEAWQTCFEPLPGGGLVCPTGSTVDRADLIVVEAFGMLGALASGLATVRPLRDITLPTRLGVLAMALKLPLGAIMAVVALRLIAVGAVPGLTALDSSLQILGWSLAIGAGQQVLTAVVDRRFAKLGTRTSRWYESVLPGVGADGHSIGVSTARSAPKHRYRIICLVVTLLGTFAAFAILAVSLGQWLPSLVGICAALVVASQGVRRSPRRRVLNRGWIFIARAAGRAGAATAIAALLVIMVDLVARAIFDAPLVAEIATPTTAGILALIIGAEVQADVEKHLLSGPAHTGPVVMPRLRSGWVRWALAGIVVTVTVLMASAEDAGSVWAWIALGTLATVSIGYVWARSSQAAAPELVEVRPTAYLAELIEVLNRDGWQVTAGPQIGSPRVDPLLEQIDLLLSRQHQALAVQIHTARPDGQQTGWRAASELLVATNALERAMRQSTVDISPVMVLVDSEADDSLRDLAQDRDLHLLQVQGGSGPTFTEQVREKFAGLRNATPAAQ